MMFQEEEEEERAWVRSAMRRSKMSLREWKKEWGKHGNGGDLVTPEGGGGEGAMGKQLEGADEAFEGGRNLRLQNQEREFMSLLVHRQQPLHRPGPLTLSTLGL
ncbi:hypothetical protein GOP47_0015034 [Adiantum capillus-veneris]|uniref:Uncharacterized protein n=1 Tax=Adiantum capillus-veneris TaxID=13818 RepID=A0A9D4ZFC4_ADICA|nr:hypothetical protein GOP47_0015034 [Adiantum capillus-veneris]